MTAVVRLLLPGGSNGSRVSSLDGKNVDYFELMSVSTIEWYDMASFLGVGFLVVLVGIMVLIRFWKFAPGTDGGDGVRKLQTKPILRIGGLPIFAVFVIAFLWNWREGGAPDATELSLSFLALGSGAFLLGFLDDLFSVPAKIKLLAQISVALGAFYTGMRIEILSNPFGAGQYDLGHFSLLVTVLWFVALPNLINLIDGMDGLAGGVSLFLVATLAVLSLLTGHFALALVCAALAGGIIGFLVFNLPPAKIYMGDGGAYFFGFFIAASSLISSNKGSVFGCLLVVVIGLGFPILDTLLAIVRRSLSGLPLMAPDARHLHHRLMTLGFSKRTILMVLYGVMAGLCLIGLSLFVSKGYIVSITGMILLLTLFAGLRFVGFPRGLVELRVVMRDIVAARKDIRYAYSLGQVLEHEIDRLEEGEDYWDSLRKAMMKLGIEPAGMSGDADRFRGDGRCAIVYSFSNDRAWHLYCPTPSSRRRQWDRVIRCFVPALVNGEQKFGEVPREFGLLRGEISGVFLDLEHLLNCEAPPTGSKEDVYSASPLSVEIQGRLKAGKILEPVQVRPC